MSPANRRRSAIPWFRAAAVVEAVSYLVLLGAAVAKRVSGADGLVPVVGPVHGVVFLGYVALAFAVADELLWPARRTLGVVVAAVLPLGGLVVGRRLRTG